MWKMYDIENIVVIIIQVVIIKYCYVVVSAIVDY